MSDTTSTRKREEKQTLYHCARELARIDVMRKKLLVASGVMRRLDLGLEFIADPQATRAQVERGETPRIPLSERRQALINACNVMAKAENDIDVILQELGVEWCVNAN